LFWGRKNLECVVKVVQKEELVFWIREVSEKDDKLITSMH